MTTQKQSALQTIEEKKSLIAGIADKVWESQSFLFRNSNPRKPTAKHWKKKDLMWNAEPAILRLRLQHRMDTDDHI